MATKKVINKFPPKKPDNSHIIKANPKREWSQFQKDLFRDIARGEGHTVVEAFAGAAKTTSIIESFKYVPKGKKVLALAFNKIIQEELRSRSPSYIETLTFHSIGFRAIRQRFLSVELDDSKCFKIVSSLLDEHTDRDLITNICDTVAFCKYGLVDTPNQIDSIIDRFGIDLCDFDRKAFIDLVVKTLAKDKADTSTIDFNDMCWFPFVYNLSLGQYDYVYVDECFPYNQSVLTENGKEKIGILFKKIKNGDDLPRVLSYNEQNNKFELCKITNAWNRGKKRLMEIKCGKRIIRCTENHKFLTNTGWVEAGKLTVGTIMKTSSPVNLRNLSQNEGHLQYALNDDQKQIVLGSFLGDGNLSKLGENKYRLSIIHGENQKDYCQWKCNMFSSKLSYIKENGFAKKPAYRFSTKSFIINDNFPKNKSTCPQWVLNDLDARGLAIWIMDDGSITNNSMNIWTSSFDEESQTRIVTKLQSMGIDCKLACYFNKKRQKHYFYIRVSALGTRKLIELIEPYMHETILYKINQNIFNTKRYEWNNKYEPFGYTIVSSVLNTDKYEDVYDIEVEKNHNFIVCSGKITKCNAGLIAHNCQDLNKSQLIMAKKACKPGGRIIAVCDSYQAVYSWRLADTTVIEDIKAQDKSKILPLPISYRCPKLIIDLAKNWVPTITCPEGTIDGSINNISINALYNTAQPGCFILSRTNAPLIKICMTFIRNGIRANIRGRDVGKQLSYLIKKSKKKQIPAFLKWLDDWKDKEVKKLEAKHINTENILDRYECLVNLCDECKTVEEVVLKTDQLFNDNDEEKMIILSTVHRAKGLERENVFVLRWTFRAWLDNCSLFEKPNEEMNLAYIAATRSKKNLFIVNKWS